MLFKKLFFPFYKKNNGRRNKKDPLMTYYDVISDVTEAVIFTPNLFQSDTLYLLLLNESSYFHVVNDFFDFLCVVFERVKLFP